MTVPTPKQREEREAIATHDVLALAEIARYCRDDDMHCGLCGVHADTEHTENCPITVVLDSLRTHSPEEPVDMVALRDARFQVDVACAEVAGRKDHLMRSAEWFRRLRDCLDLALGQPLDGKKG